MSNFSQTTVYHCYFTDLQLLLVVYWSLIATNIVKDLCIGENDVKKVERTQATIIP